MLYVQYMSKDAIGIVVQKAWMLFNVCLFVCLFQLMLVCQKLFIFLDVQLTKYGFLGWRSIDVEC